MGRDKKMFKNKKIYRGMIITVFCLLFILLILNFTFIKSYFEKMPSDFYYKAEIFSLDNFYNVEEGNFIGSQISKSKFYYETILNEEDVLIIKNVFEVRQITGDKIFYIERLYGIDRATGRHIDGYGDKNREGYLFAPKRLNKEDSFIYWHVNYDSPARMIFQNQEYLYGLKTYRYSADYNSDQTENLIHLPLVGKERGIELDIHLEIWIEPITGRLIKYEDNTIAHYYDLKTKQRIHPWNKFSNRYREDSVKVQVRIAEREKKIFIFLDFIIPITLALALLTLIFLYLRSLKKLL